MESERGCSSVVLAFLLGMLCAMLCTMAVPWMGEGYTGQPPMAPCAVRLGYLMALLAVRSGLPMDHCFVMWLMNQAAQRIDLTPENLAKMCGSTEALTMVQTIRRTAEEHRLPGDFPVLERLRRVENELAAMPPQRKPRTGWGVPMEKDCSVHRGYLCAVVAMFVTEGPRGLPVDHALVAWLVERAARDLRVPNLDQVCHPGGIVMSMRAIRGAAERCGLAADSPALLPVTRIHEQALKKLNA